MALVLTGISLTKFEEAWGGLRHYRLYQGLLQCRVFVRSSGLFEWLTVIPEGDWRTVEFAGAPRRLSLRRYVLLVFHTTPMGRFGTSSLTLSGL